jgi:hypothetical protein
MTNYKSLIRGAFLPFSPCNNWGMFYDFETLQNAIMMATDEEG